MSHRRVQHSELFLLVTLKQSLSIPLSLNLAMTLGHFCLSLLLDLDTPAVLLFRVLLDFVDLFCTFASLVYFLQNPRLLSLQQPNSIRNQSHVHFLLFSLCLEDADGLGALRHALVFGTLQGVHCGVGL